MIDDPDPDVASRPRGPNDAQRATYGRLFREGRWQDARLALQLTADGCAVAYFGFAGQTHAVHIDRAGQVVEWRENRWVTIAGPDPTHQLTLGV